METHFWMTWRMMALGGALGALYDLVPRLGDSSLPAGAIGEMIATVLVGVVSRCFSFNPD